MFDLLSTFIICHLHRFFLQSPASTSIHIHQYVCSKIWIPNPSSRSYDLSQFTGHFRGFNRHIERHYHHLSSLLGVCFMLTPVIKHDNEKKHHLQITFIYCPIQNSSVFQWFSQPATFDLQEDVLEESLGMAMSHFL